MARRFLRRWWPIPLILGVALVAESLFKRQYHVQGHAAGHLGSASALFMMLAIYAVIVWATPRARRQPDVWVAGVLLAAGLVLVLVGNLRVVNAIGSDNWTDDQAAVLGPARPGFDSGHDLAARGMSATVAVTIVLAVVLVARRHVSWRAGVGATALSLLFPPWIIPGAGVLVLAGAACVGRSRRLTASARSSVPRAPNGVGSIGEGPAPQPRPDH